MRRRRAAGAAVLLLLAVLALAAAPLPAAARARRRAAGFGPLPPHHKCGVGYVYSSDALLWGGVSDSGRCLGGHCQARGDAWARNCAFNSGRSTWGVCSPEQQASSLELARGLDGGAALRLSPCHLMQYLRGRTLWLLGDSHSQYVYRALGCFLLDFWDHRECEVAPNATLAAQLQDLPYSSKVTNCIHLLGPAGGRVCMVPTVVGTLLANSSQVAKGGVLPLLHASFAAPRDIFLVNFGAWHKGGGPDTYAPSLAALARFAAATRADWPHLLFWQTPAAHVKDDAARSCRPAPRGFRFEPASGELEQPADRRRLHSLEGWALGVTLRDAANAALRPAGVPVLPTFNFTVALHGNHVGGALGPRSQLDCTHYCQPGVPELLVWRVFAALHAGQAGVRPLSAAELAAAPRHACVAALQHSPSLLLGNLTAMGDGGLAYAHTRAGVVVRCLPAADGDELEATRVDLQHHSSVQCVRGCSIDGAPLLALGNEVGLQVWDCAGARLLWAWELPRGAPASAHHADYIGALAFAADGAGGLALAAGASSGDVHVFTIARGPLLAHAATLRHHGRPVVALGSALQSRRGAWGDDRGGGELGTICVWTPAAGGAPGGHALARVIEAGAPCAGLAVRRGLVVAGRADGVLVLYDLRDGGLRAEIAAHACGLSALDVHPSRDVVATVAEDCTVAVWSLPVDGARAACLLSAVAFHEVLTGVAFCGAGDDSVAAVAYDGDALLLWRGAAAG
ncbi:Wdr54 [Scenedesmus sp. PABB004]|nr:Wdr54 [Scenedesmus sp. PABB004]